MLYHRVPRLFDALALARGDGRHARLLKSLARVDLLILDDWGLSTLTQIRPAICWRLSTIGTDRGSTIVTSQLPVDHWHEAIPNPTIADAILDRLVHNAHRLTLTARACEKRQPSVPDLTSSSDACPHEAVDGSRCPPSPECCPRSTGFTVRLQTESPVRHHRNPH